MPQGDGSLLIRGANIFYRNFEGRELRYNAKGDRNFCVELDPKTAEMLAADRWNIKTKDPRDEGDEGSPFVQVKVQWSRQHAPQIYLVTTLNGQRHKRTRITEDLVDLLDSVEIANVDLIIRPREWDDNGRPRIKAYLKSLYITVVEDELEAEYAELDNQPLSEPMVD